MDGTAAAAEREVKGVFKPINVTQEITGSGQDLLLLGDGSAPNQALAKRAGLAQAVYIDPPFMTGERFMRRRRFGARGWRTGSPSPAYPSYEDCYDSREAYDRMLRGLIENAWLLLGSGGMLCLHLDWHSSARARLMCDEVFGEERFVNEVIWAYESGGRARRYFSRKHDTILLYAKSKSYRFRVENVPLARGESRRNHLRRCVDENGRSYRSIKTGGKEYRYYDDDPVYPGDVWTDISHLQQRDPERTGFMTQKPQKLLDRLLRPLVEEDDLVCDLCCGSGTALAAAQALGCHVLGMDTNPEALLVTQSRLSGASLALTCPCTMDDTPLYGTCDTNSGAVLLSGFPAQHPSFPPCQDALEPLERWSVGRLCPDGTLRVLQVFQRSCKQPELIPMCVVPSGEGPLAVSTVDAAGKRRVYQWFEDEA